jgi:hypothetical protein
MKDRTLNDFSARSLSRSLNNGSALQNSKTRFRENLGTLRNRASVTDEVTEDEANTYTFRLNRRTNLNVKLENREDSDFFGGIFGTRRRVQARLLDSSGDVLRSTDRVAPDDDDDFRVRLSAGTYAIRITGRSENEVEYRLNLRTSNNNFDDDNDDDDDDFDFDFDDD